MVDLDGDGVVIWDYELHDGLVLDQEKSVTFFHSFEIHLGAMYVASSTLIYPLLTETSET